MVQVIGNVPALAKTIDFWSPGANDVPLLELNSVGAPLIAENCPPWPMTRLCTPPPVEGSSKSTAWPALIVTLVFPLKLNFPKVIVAAAVDAVVAAGAVVAVGAGGVVALAAGEDDPPPQAASMNARLTSRRPANFRMDIRLSYALGEAALQRLGMRWL